MNQFGSFIDINKAENIVQKHVNHNDPMKGDELISVVNSKYVLPLLDMFETVDKREKVFTFPYAKGGDLFNYLEQLHRPLTESQCKIVLKRVLKGIRSLHRFGICHRDIKPHNILLMEEGDLNSCVIADLGVSCEFTGNGYISGFCGTEYFMAPEIQCPESQYNEKVDIWSVGALAFFLLTNGESISNEYMKDIGNLTVSDNLQYLLIELLGTDPYSRRSASAALKHPFFEKKPEEFDVFKPLKHEEEDFNFFESDGYGI